MPCSRESGQTAVEYLLVMSVLSIVMIGGAFVFYPDFRSGVAALADDVRVILSTHELPEFGSGAPLFDGGGTAGSPSEPAAPPSAPAGADAEPVDGAGEVETSPAGGDGCLACGEAYTNQAPSDAYMREITRGRGWQPTVTVPGIHGTGWEGMQRG